MRVGIDIVDVNRFERIASDEVKLATLFTAKEIAYFKNFANPTTHIAGTFSAKEAVAKAFKTGFTPDVLPLEIEILHENKVPRVNLKGGAKKFFEEQGFTKIDISISHTNTIAEAICIIE